MSCFKIRVALAQPVLLKLFQILDMMTNSKTLSSIRNRIAMGALPIAFVALTPSTAEAFQLTGLYVFSDSLSDVGNFYAFTNNQLPPPQLGYFNGRFSNGPVWVDYLAPRLGLTSDIRTNFSFPGLTTGTTNTTIPNVLPGLQQQIPRFTQATPQADPNALYILWAGANDYLGGQQTNPAIPVANLANAIQSLAGVGAKNFLVANLPDLGQVPLVRDRGAAVSQGATALTNGHNALLAQTLATLGNQLAPIGVNLIPLDVNTVFSQAIANPAQFGLTNTSDPCLFPSPLLFSNTGGRPDPITVCPNPNQYLFWDSLHPSTTAHRLVGEAAFQTLSASAVPEPPATAGMIVFGAFMTSLVVRKAKQKRKISL
ncbi:MAG: SGNH/GDSL hydrolase family protein [Oscillatoriales cyanobacterium C42_A2020_001]|nr:SGNH/GDSL hydrolase family protein [Leptolyngbyaceae cyanobacterium C42_A2020_001]